MANCSHTRIFGLRWQTEFSWFGELCVWGAGLQLWFLLLKPSIPTEHPDTCGHIWVRGGEGRGSAGAAATQTWANVLMRDGTMSLVPWVLPPPISGTLGPPGCITEHLLVTAASTTLLTAQFPSWMGTSCFDSPKLWGLGASKPPSPEHKPSEPSSR